MPMRFYRVVDLGPDTTSDEPKVVITSPTNNIAATGELTVTVAATTDQPVLTGTKLYVDGQEERPATVTTNYTDATGITNYEVDTYTLNTCEWGNRVHTLFATAECQSGNGDAINSAPIASGHGVSPMVPVLFSNLVTLISFSQPSFDPTSGQTQQVSAVFAHNANWTLNVENLANTVLYTNQGSGISMQVNWNGKSNSGTNLPQGIYYYYISASTNGHSDSIVTGGGGGGGTPPPPALGAASFSHSESTEWWVTPSDGSGGLAPLALYPPGFDTNDLTIFGATPSDIASLRPATSSSMSLSGGGFHANAAGGSSSPSQNSPASPQRTPANPIVGVSGLYGVAYDTYGANGTNTMSAPTIPNIPGVPGSYIGLDGFPANANLKYGPVPSFAAEANNFSTEMQLFGWVSKIHKIDDQLKISDLQGSGTPFNNVSLGVLMTHGAYGTNQDYLAGLCKQMYFPITSGGSIQYLRMSDMNLGGTNATNGLKWFAFMACDSLHQANWNSMKNAEKQPYKGNMHMILGGNSIIYTSPRILFNFAQYTNLGYTNSTPLTIHDAFYLAAHNAYHGHSFTNNISMAVASDSNCTGDYIEQGFNSAPGGTWTYESEQVWP